jgi:hypothetical protein
MAYSPNEFSPAPDPHVRAALGAALQPGDRAGFIAAVLARAEALPARREAAVRRWSRAALGAAAALVAGLVTGLVAGRATSAPAFVDADFVASTTGSTSAAMFLTAEQPPDPRTLFAPLVEE